MLFDTHAHYAEEDGPFSAWFRRAETSGVSRILLCSSGWENTALSASCTESVETVSFAAGIHPHDAEAEIRFHGVQEYAVFARNPKCAAIGEIGLDLYYDKNTLELQLEVFSSFLELALSCGLPAVVHCRDKSDDGPAYEQAYALLAPFARRGGRFVLHAFAGSPAWLEKFAALGAFFGIGGMITFKKADNIRLLASRMPEDRILLETDSPYLAPVPFRGKPNHPSLLPYTAEALAEVRKTSRSEMEERTFRNAMSFFRPDTPKRSAAK